MIAMWRTRRVEKTMPTYYLSPSGNDTANGLTPATTWQTITRANANAWQDGDTLLLEGWGVFSGSLLFNGVSVSVDVYGPGRWTILHGGSCGIRYVGATAASVKNGQCVGSGWNANGTGTSDHACIEVILPPGAANAESVTLRNLCLEGAAAGWEVRVHSEGITGTCPQVGIIDASEIWIRDVGYHGYRAAVIPLLAPDGSPLSDWTAYSLTGTHPSSPNQTPGNNNWLIFNGLAFDEVRLGPHDVVRAYGISSIHGIHTGDCGPIRNARKVRGYTQRGRDSGAAGDGSAGFWAQECHDVQWWYCHVDNHKSSTGIDGDGFDSDGGAANSWHIGCVATRCQGAGFLFGPYDGSVVPTGGWIGCVSIDCAVGHPYLTPFYAYGGAVPQSTNCTAITTQAPDAPPVPPANDFSAGWQEFPIGSGGTVSVSGGTVMVSGTRFGTVPMFAGDIDFAFDATFTGDPYQHAGLSGSNNYDDVPWATFSTHGGGNLYARTGSTETVLGSSLLGSAHRYRIIRSGGLVTYFVDDSQVAQHAGPDSPLRPCLCDQPGGGLLAAGNVSLR